MFSNSNRINKKLFKEIFKKGISYNGGLLYIKVFKLNNNKEKRYSFTVSKSVSRLAVKRNFLKRRARHIIKTNISKIKDGHAVVFFFTKKSALTASFKELESEILKILQKAKM